MSDEQMGFDKLEDAVAALVSERGAGQTRWCLGDHD